MQLGTFDFLPLPHQMSEVERIVRNALEASEPVRAVAATSLGQT
jgi:DNA-binding NtrC family response regulator